MNKKNITKIVLAYSGGLDTSIIVPYLKEQYDGAKIIGVCVNVGQKEDWERVTKRAEASGAEKLYIIDAKERFVRDFLFPMIQAGAAYENNYLLGTAIARPLQAEQQVRIAIQEQADALAHGCTGKGNDQVRFELGYKALAPQMDIIAPWRMWDIRSRSDAIEFAHQRNIDLGDISKKNIYSRDWNMWHISHEGGDLEDIAHRPPADLQRISVTPQNAPDKECKVKIEFKNGAPVAIDDTALAPIPLLERLNELGAQNGIGCIDIVETRLIGMKSRGVYETPGGTILWRALRELETIVYDHSLLETKQYLGRKYGELTYGGLWFSQLRESIDAFMAHTCRMLDGTISLALYKGNIIITGREAAHPLYDKNMASFEAGAYDHSDATGFVKLYGLSTTMRALTERASHISQEAHPAKEKELKNNGINDTVYDFH